MFHPFQDGRLFPGNKSYKFNDVLLDHYRKRVFISTKNYNLMLKIVFFFQIKYNKKNGYQIKPYIKL